MHTAKFYVKKTNLSLRSKLPYLVTFRPKFEETIVILKSCFILVFLDYNLKKTFVIFEINSLKIIKKKKKKKIFTTLVNFSIRSAFSKGPGPGLGPLFKEPQNIGENKMLFSQWRSRVKIHGRILMNVNELYCNQRIYGV